MLSRLCISNFALIREMEVTFPGGLTVITGETGAGKSIFLEALGLALGRRAEIGEGNRKKCVVEAEFRVSRDDFASLFEVNELDADDVMILRREISADGRSRALVNDSVVPVTVLRDFASRLVDIHSQHQTLSLNQGKFQLGLVDAFAGNADLLRSYKDHFSNLNSLRKELAQLEEREAAARKEQDYLEFLFTELTENRLEAGQLAKLQEECSRLENAETIKSALFAAANITGAGDSNVLSALVNAKNQLAAISKFSPDYTLLFDRLNAAYIELKDVYAELGSEGERVELDNNRLDEVNLAIDRLARLMKKHAVKTEDELLLVRDGIGQKLSAFSGLEARTGEVREQIVEAEKKCRKLAGDLAAKRAKAVPQIEKEVSKMLAGLSMPNATFRIEVSKTERLQADGDDVVSFLFSANRGMELQEIHKVASGGELSRLMLCLKAMLAEKKNLPAIIFDEIDTGVSGEVAAKIGAILYKMSARLQVIAITHLPQMASRGEHHLFVYKHDEKEQTVSCIKLLKGDERVLEIAKMLSAGEPGTSALKNARELLSA